MKRLIIRAEKQCLTWVGMMLGLLVLSSCEPSPETSRGNNAIDLLAAAPADGFLKANQPRSFVFPDDHGKHSGFRTQWWYVTGNLKVVNDNQAAGESRSDFGYQLTFFRWVTDPNEDANNLWESDALWLAQVALTDVQGERFYTSEVLSRELPDIADSATQHLDVSVNGWRLWQPDPDGDKPSLGHYQIAIQANDFQLQLSLNATKPLVLQGDEGLSIKSADNPDNASYYYSQTRLQTQGIVHVGQQAYSVSGDSWLDREWSTSALNARQSGWDWFALQLNNGYELMFYQLRLDNGERDAASAGVWVDPQGQVTAITADDVDIQMLDQWRDAKTRTSYPVNWQLTIPRLGLQLKIDNVLPNQLWQGQFQYWEGAVEIQGKYSGEQVIGSGYVELTGY